MWLFSAWGMASVIQELTFKFNFNCLKLRVAGGSVLFSSVSQSSPTLCDPVDYNTSGLPDHHQLLEFTQIHVHWVTDTIKPSHPLSSPWLPNFNLSQHQGLVQWVNSLHQVDKVLELLLQHQSFQWTPGLSSFRVNWLYLLAVQGTLKSLLQHHTHRIKSG